jgi:hypothetical protein
MAITGASKIDVTVYPGPSLGDRPLDTGVKTMIEANLDQTTGSLGRPPDSLDISGASTCGFLD